MTTVMASSSHLAPSENWDDDFEFHQPNASHSQNTTPRKQSQPSHDQTRLPPTQHHAPNADVINDFNPPLPSIPTRMSTASSTWTSDWDRESQSPPSPQSQSPPDQSSAPPLTPPANSNNNPNNPNFNSPTTPVRPFESPEETENWDADFEDHPSPTRAPPRQPSTPTKRTKKSSSGTTPRRRRKSGSDGEDEHESWDEEFGLDVPPPPSRGTRRRRLVLGSPTSPGRTGKRISFGGDRRLGDIASSDDDAPPPLPPLPKPPAEDDVDSDEFGPKSNDDEEDKTVTSRSRRALSLSRSSTSSSHPSPPPVPPFPTFLGMGLSSTVGLGILPSPPQPFPRSPTSSVFSVPTTADHASQYHGSTTHLRGSFTRSGGNTLSGLPPSPPIHRERERRRLRKKSRPVAAGPGVFELSEVDPEEGRARSMSRPRTPSPPRPAVVDPIPVTPPKAGVSDVLSTPSGGLLSRIGSVKRKWARRKKGSLAPEDVAGGDEVRGRVSGLSSYRTPRSTSHPPTTFLRLISPLITTPLPPPTKQPLPLPSPAHTHAPPTSRFFRTQATNTLPRPVTGSRSGSMTDLSLHQNQQHESDSHSTPSKLLKRKSLGFVQLRKEEAKRPVSMQGSPSFGIAGRYGGIGIGRTASSKEKERDVEGEGKRSVSRARGEVVVKESVDEDREEKVKGREEKEKEKDGSRGFMGSVRRISLVGRHKRTKSGVSLTGVVEDTPSPPPHPPRIPSRSGTLRSKDSRTHLRSSIGSRPSADGHLTRPSTDAPFTRPSTDKSEHPRTPSKSQKTKALLPPIELQPPSPPRVHASSSAPPAGAAKEPMSSFSLLSPASSSSSVLTTPTSPNTKSPTSSRKASGPKSPGSPQSASLGRATINPNTSPGHGAGTAGSAGVLRRNSLGDLKIPARISQAQVGLRRDLGMVREFAANVEQLRVLQDMYHVLVLQVQDILDTHALALSQVTPQPRASSPTFFKKRNRSNTNPTVPPPSPSQIAYRELASSFYTINSKYRISWECAELLIELATGSSSASSPPSITGPASASQQYLPQTERKTSRERAITLAGDESKPPTPTPGATSSSAPSMSHSPPLASPPALAWRASTGRHDLSQRQLVLLREMLNRADSTLLNDPIPIPEESTTSLNVQRGWGWGDPMSSTLTLPSTESSNIGHASPMKKRRQSRLGMSGLRDMLRALKRSTSSNAAEVPPIPTSSTSLSTGSSMDSHQPSSVQGRRRAKTSTGPESMRSDRASPYGSPPLPAKASPRRPSLASIFRLGKNRATTAGSSSGESRMGSVEQFAISAGEEDWDRIDSVTDLDAAARGLGINPDGTATVRGKKSRSPYYAHELSSGYPGRPVTPKRSVSGSQTSLWGGDSPSSSSLPQRPTRLSNVEENADGCPTRSSSKARRGHGTSPARPSSRSSRVPKSGSVRSMPPQPIGHPLPDSKLAMTPDNIKPLLENTKEVHARLTECISEIQSLLENRI
ncbi:hypothetical protein BDQ17DRAFT_1332263 [Cyathus striatus]|nr:hypothetical protein BDQ17DRAFT_1332263 [Cyathus striatus]